MFSALFKSSKKNANKSIKPLPSCDLFDLVIDRNWEYVETHATRHPEDCTFQDFNGSDGWETPLYLAVQYQAPLSTINALINACPESLHIKNRNGNIPLHLACHTGSSAHVIEALVVADLSTVFAQTKWGKTPLRALHEGSCNPSNPSSTNDAVEGREEMSEESKLLYMQKIEILLRAVAQYENLKNDKGELLLLHAAVSFGCMGCPEEIFNIIFPKYQHQIFEYDQQQRLPLHIAAGPSKWRWPKMKRSYKPRERHVFDALLNHNKDAVHIPLNGQYPLHIALSNGHTMEGGVRSLFNSGPEYVSFKDPLTGLYPFMLAGLPCGENSRSLTTIFLLVSSQPDLLKNFCKPTNVANENIEDVCDSNKSWTDKFFGKLFEKKSNSA